MTAGSFFRATAVVIAAFALLGARARADIAILGETIYTMAGAPIRDGVVLIQGGKITSIGTRNSTSVPGGYRVLRAKVVTPGLIDAHTVIGLSGILNQPHDQEQIEKSAPMQPELRAIDAYNPRDPLVEWVRNFGVTTLHTGHGPGALISGQSIIIKTYPENLEAALIATNAMVMAALGEGAVNGDKPPGTRSKAIAMLRAELIKAQDYTKKQDKAEPDKRPARDLHLEVLARILKKEIPLLVTAQRYQDVLAALRVASEFDLKIVLDGVSEGYLVLDEIEKSGFPVIVHPTMYRSQGQHENLSMETAAKLRAAGIPIALQSGFEGYVPKTRVVLFEAAVACANGLPFEQALASITIDAARILGVQDRIGSLEAGKDADIALYDGDPFEYTTHCVGVIVSGNVVSETAH